MGAAELARHPAVLISSRGSWIDVQFAVNQGIKYSRDYVLTDGEKQAIWQNLDRTLVAAASNTDKPRFSLNFMDVLTFGPNTLLKVNFNREDQRGLTVWTVLGFYGTRHVVTVSHCGLPHAPSEGVEGLDVIAQSFRFESEQVVVQPVAAATTLVAAVSSSEWQQPQVWKPGYEWAYRYESPTGKGTYVWSMDREEIVDGVPHYVIKTGTREIFHRKSDFASTRETLDGVVVLSTKPSRLQLVWPLKIGKTWEQTYVEERPKTRQTLERVDTVTVEAEETVTVPAGTFKTLKVVYRNKKTGTIRYEAWYSLEVKQVVKLRENLETGTRTRELIAFKLR